MFWKHVCYCLQYARLAEGAEAQLELTTQEAACRESTATNAGLPSLPATGPKTTAHQKHFSSAWRFCLTILDLLCAAFLRCLYLLGPGIFLG